MSKSDKPRRWRRRKPEQIIAEERLTDAQRDLVAANLGLAGVAAREAFKRYAKIATFDDLHQHARLGLLRAARRFDPARGFKFSTFALPLCRHWCDIMVAKDIRRRSKGQYFRPMPVGADGELWEPANNDRGPAKSVEDAEEYAVHSAALAMAMSQLDPRERMVLQRRYDGETLEQVSDLIGVTRERVRQIQKQALARVRKLMGVAA